jgi:putative phage-type endonuclease
MEQRTDEWFAARLGKVTASKVSDVVAKTKSGYGATRSTYMTDLAIERLTGNPTEFYANAAMQWGTDVEPQARAAYEFLNDAVVVEEGFIEHPSIPMSGASPDGMVNDEGMLEIKCPMSKTHYATLLSGKIAKKYIDQMQWQMACAGRQWCDFVSFDPRMPEGLDFFCKRVDRDDEYIGELETEVSKFLEELNEQVTKLEGLKK